MTQKLKIASQGKGVPLVFLHGWGMNSQIWHACLDHLKNQYQVITIDLPGFASNRDVLPSDYTLIEIANLVVNAVNKPAVYIGWSLGGLVAKQISLLQAKDVLALVTIASSPLFMATESWLGIKPNVLRSFYQQLADDREKTITSFLKIQAMGSQTIRQDIKTIKAMLLQHHAPSQEVLANALALLEKSDLRQQLNLVTCPFLRLYGRLDTLVPAKAISAINRLSSQSDVHIFERSSHAPFISEQDEFLTVLKGWLINQAL